MHGAVDVVKRDLAGNHAQSKVYSYGGLERREVGVHGEDAVVNPDQVYHQDVGHYAPHLVQHGYLDAVPEMCPCLAWLTNRANSRVRLDSRVHEPSSSPVSGLDSQAEWTHVSWNLGSSSTCRPDSLVRVLTLDSNSACMTHYLCWLATGALEFVPLRKARSQDVNEEAYCRKDEIIWPRITPAISISPGSY